MRHFTIKTVALLFFLSCISISFINKVQAAQDSDLAELKKQLEGMEETIKKQQEMINALKDRIESREEYAAESIPKTMDKVAENSDQEAIRSRQGSGGSRNYETLRYEATQEEIHNAISDYLGTDEGKELITKASPDRIKAGYKTGKGLSIESLDEKFNLNMLGRLQTRYNFRNNEDAEDLSSFRINRMRLKLSGHSFTQNLKYNLEWELNSFSGRGQLKDVFVDYQFLPELHLRGGQWKVPYNRQNIISDYKKQFIDESITNDAFSLDRDPGIMLHGELFENRLEYYAGVFTGRGINATENTNNKNMAIGKIAYRPFGEFKDYWESDLEYTESFRAAFGAAFAINNGTEIFFSDELQTFSKDAQFMQFGLDSIMKYRGFSLQGEYHLRLLDRRGFNRDTANGFFVQGGYFLVPELLELAGRYSQFDPDVNVSNNLRKEFALGTNWYISKDHHHKLQANVTRLVTDRPTNDREDTLISIMHQIEW